jgi:hypothetical protein
MNVDFSLKLRKPLPDMGRRKIVDVSPSSISVVFAITVCDQKD